MLFVLMGHAFAIWFWNQSMSHPAPKNEASPSPEEFISRCEREHRILKELYSDLVVAYNQHYRRQTTGKILHVLEMYVKFHFGNEEKFMKTSGYPDIKNHTDIHNKSLSCYRLLVCGRNRRRQGGGHGLRGF